MDVVLERGDSTGYRDGLVEADLDDYLMDLTLFHCHSF